MLVTVTVVVVASAAVVEQPLTSLEFVAVTVRTLPLTETEPVAPLPVVPFEVASQV